MEQLYEVSFYRGDWLWHDYVIYLVMTDSPEKAKAIAETNLMQETQNLEAMWTLRDISPIDAQELKAGFCIYYKHTEE